MHGTQYLASGVAGALILLSTPNPAFSQQQADTTTENPPTSAEVLANTKKHEWRQPNPENLVLFEFASGTMVVELVPAFAPKHLERVRALVRGGFFNGGNVVRSQDNYVAQWTTRSAEGDDAIGSLANSLDAEFERPAVGVPFLSTSSPDAYAPEAGFAIGQAVARDLDANTMWLVHCYGAVGVARDVEPDTGNGTQLYVVTGHAPRHLDRNMTMLGRAISGLEHLSTLARGSGDLGFFTEDEQQVPLHRAVMASDLPKAERPRVELLRTNSDSFAALLAARAARTESFFVHAANGIDVCNVPIPVRDLPAE